jgi:ABC-type multidrug transport system fused ATPase/permease subunit
MDLDTWKKAWALLEANERRTALMVLSVVVLGALSSALMVGSVLPFLSVLSQPERIETVPSLAWAYERFGFKSDHGFLVGLGLAVLFVIVLASAMQIFRIWAVARFATMRIHSISHRLLATYLRQPYEFFLNRHSGEMSTRILAETEQLVNQFLRPAAEAIASMFTIVAVVSLLIWVEPIIALVSLSVISCIYGLIYWVSRRALKGLGRARVKANSARFRICSEALSGIKDIKLLGRESGYVARYETPSRSMAAALSTVEIVSLIPKFALEAIAFGGIILLCLILMDPDSLQSGAALGGILPILGLFAFAGQRLMPELQKLYQSLARIQAGGASVNAVYDDLVNQLNDGRLPLSIPTGLGLSDRIVLDNVSYRYPDAKLAGLNGISLDINAGERIGIVGSTGAGKTTLADMILGLLPPSEGRIIVDGAPITDENLRAWQQSVGYVPQDIFLTDANIYQNIALGVPMLEIDQPRVRRAAEIARIDDFIRNDLPDEYETAIGERGVRLSGGQRQRIGIARALYHEADLIVFDEATSALDNLTELEVMSAIDALPGDKTVLIIAHRLSTVKRCDRIIVMDKGRVVACDTWDTLMTSNSEFQKIANVNEVT